MAYTIQCQYFVSNITMLPFTDRSNFVRSVAGHADCEPMGNVDPLDHGHTVRRDAAGIGIQVSVNREHS